MLLQRVSGELSFQTKEEVNEEGMLRNKHAQEHMVIPSLIQNQNKEEEFEEGRSTEKLISIETRFNGSSLPHYGMEGGSGGGAEKKEGEFLDDPTLLLRSMFSNPPQSSSLSGKVRSIVQGTISGELLYRFSGELLGGRVLNSGGNSAKKPQMHHYGSKAERAPANNGDTSDSSEPQTDDTHSPISILERGGGGGMSRKIHTIPPKPAIMDSHYNTHPNTLHYPSESYESTPDSSETNSSCCSIWMLRKAKPTNTHFRSSPPLSLPQAMQREHCEYLSGNTLQEVELRGKVVPIKTALKSRELGITPTDAILMLSSNSTKRVHFSIESPALTSAQNEGGGVVVEAMEIARPNLGFGINSNQIEEEEEDDNIPSLLASSATRHMWDFSMPDEDEAGDNDSSDKALPEHIDRADLFLGLVNAEAEVQRRKHLRKKKP